jgi:methylase of polypeptide subunit release factors
MNKKLSQLDSSYWTYSHPDLETAQRKFLKRHSTAGVYEIAGLTFNCPSGIYQPHEFGSTRFAIRGLFSQSANLGHRILELGTGSGAIGICLAAAGFDVTLLDIDPAAVECATNNAVANNIAVTVLQSDLFTAVESQQFDVIFFNIPLQDKPIEDPLEVIACDHGGELFTRFMTEAKNYLSPNGQVCVSVGNIGNRAAILKALSDYDENILFAEFYAATSAWRWLLSARPLSVIK